MDFQIIFFTTYETILSVVFSLVTIFIIYTLVNRTLLKRNADSELKKGNISVGIFPGGVIVCVLILVQSSILPSVNALRTMVLSGPGIKLSAIVLSFAYFILFYCIALVISAIVILLSIAIYMKATKNIDEVNEINKNNIAVSIMLTLVLVGVMFFIQPSVSRLIASFVNYDKLERIYMLKNDSNSGDKLLVPPPGHTPEKEE